MKGFLIVALASLTACARSQTESSPGAASASPASGAEAGPTASAAAGEAAAPSSPHAVASWQGTYKSVAGSLYIPADWKGVRYVLKDTTEGLGDGRLSLQIDPASGRIAGTVDGPLGPATIEGVAHAGKLFATVRRTDPTDRGFTGTLEGTTSGDRAQGTMSLSQAEVNAIRAATFVLTPGGAAR